MVVGSLISFEEKNIHGRCDNLFFEHGIIFGGGGAFTPILSHGAIKLYCDSKVPGYLLKYELRIQLHVDNYKYITNWGARRSNLQQHFNYKSHHLSERSLRLANDRVSLIGRRHA